VAANGSGVAAAVALFAEGLVALVGDVVWLLQLKMKSAMRAIRSDVMPNFISRLRQ
jgi:hypothetical protein